MLLQNINTLVASLDVTSIPENRLPVLQRVIDYIQTEKDASNHINLNLICTHNSRRSHMSQIWAQTMAAQYGISNVYCYSGGTEATAMFHMVGETLKKQGFIVEKLSDTSNPVYAVKFSEIHQPVVAFSKTFDSVFNPKSNFAAVMTCNHADQNCPFIPGATRITLTYEDPKAFDNTPQQKEKYAERSIQIATEMKYIFSNIK